MDRNNAMMGESNQPNTVMPQPIMATPQGVAMVISIQERVGAERREKDLDVLVSLSNMP